jgi:hypothetical protein
LLSADCSEPRRARSRSLGYLITSRSPRPTGSIGIGAELSHCLMAPRRLPTRVSHRNRGAQEQLIARVVGSMRQKRRDREIICSSHCFLRQSHPCVRGSLGSCQAPLQRREHHEEIGEAVELIFVAVARRVAGLGGNRRARLGDQSFGGLVQAHERTIGVSRSLGFQDVFHGGYEACIGFGRDVSLQQNARSRQYLRRVLARANHGFEPIAVLGAQLHHVLPDRISFLATNHLPSLLSRRQRFRKPTTLSTKRATGGV